MPTSPCAKSASVTRESESHAVLDAEREPVPGEIRRTRQADDRDHRCAGHKADDPGASRRGHREGALALGHDLVALDERGGHLSQAAPWDATCQTRPRRAPRRWHLARRTGWDENARPAWHSR